MSAARKSLTTTKRVATTKRRGTGGRPGATDRRIDALLTLLADNPMIVISGQKIAREIGVSRSAVWRWTQQLRALGVRVKGHPRSGYRIERIPDVLSPSLLSRNLRGSAFGKRIHHYFKIGSTNTVAFELARAGEPHGTLVLAEEQTAGRGRARRKWHSEKTSGIYISIVLRPQISPLLAPLLTMVAGLALRDSVLELTGVAPDLRWPNDLLIRGKKFAGILTEMHAEPDRVHFVIVGIGVDVNHATMPAEIAEAATSLRIATGKTHSRLQMVVKLLRHIETYYNRLLTAGPEPILARFTDVSSFARGKRVCVTSATEKYTGITDGLEPNGLLRVRRDYTGNEIARRNAGQNDAGDDKGGRKKHGRIEIVYSGDVAEAT